jgi:oligopeptidase A
MTSTSTSTSLTDNALFTFAKHGGLPPFARLSPEQVGPAINALLATLRDDVAALEARLMGAPAGYDDVVEAVATITEPVERAWGVVGHLMGVKNTPALREAQQQAQPLVVAAMMQLAQSASITAALQAIKDSAAFSSLSPARRRIVDSKLMDARLSGFGLEGEKLERFNAIQQELSDLATRFSNNVLDATKAWSLTLTNSADVDGLPASWKSSASSAYVEAARVAGNEVTSTPEGGPWRVGLDMPSLLPFMRYATNRARREEVYRANLARASELDGGQHDNRPLIARILELRHEKAALLGYSSYAALSLATKMAPSTTEVHRLLGELRDVSRPVALAELTELSAFAGFEVRHHDVEFWSEKLREARYAYSDEALRQYFPFPAVLEGLFGVCKRLFDIDVVDHTHTVDRWNDDVRFFRVQRDGKEIAAFFLDPYARPADKRGGAWMDDCITRRRHADGSVRLPVAYLVCNQPPPADGKPSLLPLRDVETLFHEFGHGLQHMLTQVDDVDASGIRNVEWDAVELPSQFMENWVTHKATLLGFARHVDTNEPLPEETFEKVKSAKTFRSASIMLRQLMFSTVDLAAHEGALPAGKTVFDVQREIAVQNAVLPVLDEDRFLCSFSHIFAGGYAAGYYSYKWAEVLSADAFGAFEDAGLDDEAAVKAVGARFRDTVLSLGGSVHPGEVFEQFRGRAPSTAALLRHAGLARAA